MLVEPRGAGYGRPSTRLGIVLDTGLVVRVRGEVQLYKPRGDISFILSELDTDALLGKVAAERARLIKALVDEDSSTEPPPSDPGFPCGSGWWPARDRGLP